MDSVSQLKDCGFLSAVGLMITLIIVGRSVSASDSLTAVCNSGIVLTKCPFMLNICIRFSYRVSTVNTEGGVL